MSDNAQTQCQLLRGGVEFFPLLVKDIEQAKEEVRIETYIFRFDAAGGEPIAQALVAAALRGVRVCLMLDGAGTPDIPREWAEKFQKANVYYASFVPFGRFGIFKTKRWRRLHRKLCVIDGTIAYCGGINFIDDNVDPYHGPLQTPRLDFTVRLQGGQVVADTLETMLIFWRRYELAYHMDLINSNEFNVIFKGSFYTPPKANYHPTLGDWKSETHQKAYLILRDNINNRKSIEYVYLEVLAQAKKEILIANAYFLPGQIFRTALIHAAQRGLRVRLIIQGRLDNFFEYHAVQPLHEELMHYGVEIFEYNNGFLHAKVAVIDGVWSTVGSSNLDPLSLLMAREANIVIEGREFATELQSQLESVLSSHCGKLTIKKIMTRRWYQRWLDSLMWIMVRIVVRFFDKNY